MTIELYQFIISLFLMLIGAWGVNRVTKESYSGPFGDSFPLWGFMFLAGLCMLIGLLIQYGNTLPSAWKAGS